MEWNDFDFDRGTVLIQRAKGGISSTHHLDGDVLRALRAIKRDQAPGVRHVFHGLELVVACHLGEGQVNSARCQLRRRPRSCRWRLAANCRPVRMSNRLTAGLPIRFARLRRQLLPLIWIMLLWCTNLSTAATVMALVEKTFSHSLSNP